MLNFTVPAPSSVTVTSDKPNPIRPIGSNVTLICTVELSPAVDVPITVSTIWTGPNGALFPNDSDSEAVMENHTVYTSTVTFSSFGKEQSGNYTCTASVNSLIPFVDDSNSTTNSTVTEVTVGKPLL